ncbi:quinone oxidoreductase [Pleosporales sp. CAS-2024a]
MSPQQTRQWVLQNPPQKDAVLSGPDATFSLQTIDLAAPSADQALVKVLYFSNDPAQRGWIQKNQDPARLYVPPVQVGEVMRSYGIGQVIESGSDTLKPGQLVMGALGWTEYAVVKVQDVRPIQADEASGIRATHFLGTLGVTGLTAYYGLLEIARATKDDIVVVSGAAGATGSVAVQLAKHVVGCKKVIGIAGGAAKCAWVQSLGADVCLDYKAPSFTQDVLDATPGFVHVYFDNVGGHILDLMLTRLAPHGRIAACGSVATYNAPGSQGLKNWFEVITNRLEIKGFIVLDAMAAGKAPAWLAELAKAAKQGKIQMGEDTETVVPTKFDHVPKTWTMLFEGGNQGKLITALTA